MILAACVLLAVYLVYFTTWFKSKTLLIYHTTGTRGLALRNRQPGVPVITFALESSMRLTEVKVVAVAALATNDRPVAMWHLVSISNSIPCKSFRYGQHIQGMKPFVASSPAKPLETNVAYRLFVTAGRDQGQHDFTYTGQ